MIEIKIQKSWVSKSARRAHDMGRLHNSITRGGGNIYGEIGEEVALNYLNATRKNTYDYDMVRNGKTIDVKTKHCTSMPKPEYECSVAAYNTKQDCDIYVFVRVLKSLQKAWLLGWMPKKEFFKKARFCKKDEVDKKSTFGWKFKGDCYNMPISELHRFNKRND